MTKEEQKADELIEMFKINIALANSGLTTFNPTAIECAIKCVDEIIKEVIIFKQHSMGGGLASEQLYFWQSVKQHILNKQ